MRRLVRSGMLLLAISTVPLRADPAGAWRREFRGTDTAVDAGAHAVVLDGAGDVIAAGELTNVGTGPAFTVAKLDGATGGQLWRTEINGPATSFSRATAVTVDAAGDVIAAGWLQDFNDTDFIVVKLAGASGAELWRYEIDPGIGQSAFAHAVAVDALGDVVAVGRVDLPGPFRFTVAKIAGATGVEVWRQDLVGDAPVFGSNSADAVAVDSAGDVVAVGRIDNDTTGIDLAVVKLAGGAGTVLWRVEIDEGNDDAARAVAVDAADDVVVGGHLRIGPGDDYAVMKLAGATGAEIWRQVTSGPNGFSSDRALAVAVDGAGDVISAGHIDNRQIDTEPDLDFAVIKLAGASGTELWRREINGTTTIAPPRDLAHAVAVDPSGDVLAAGIVSNRSTFFQGQDFAVVRLDGTTGATEWQQALQGASTVKGAADNALAVAVDATGAAIAVGFLTNPTSTADFAVVRLGALDGAVGPVRGTKLTVRDRAGDATAQVLIAAADDQAIVAPASGSAGDPTLFGATLRLQNPGTLETATIPLPALHWTALATGGFDYRGPGGSGPCTTVRVRPRRQIKARCTGRLGTIPFSLDEPSQSTLAVSLQLGGADRQCAIFGGASVVRDVGITGPTTTGVFRARRANPPSADCP